MPIRIAHDYRNLAEQPLVARGFTVAGLILTATYTVVSTVTAAILKAKSQAAFDAIVVCKTGTAEDTIKKNVLLAELLTLLDTFANDVENAANTAKNTAIVPAFGYLLATSTRTNVEPGLTAILSVTNSGPGGLKLELLLDPNARCYLVEDTLMSTGTVTIHTFTDPNDVNLINLTSGSMHSLRACTMVANNKCGPFCEPVQHMST